MYKILRLAAFSFLAFSGLVFAQDGLSTEQKKLLLASFEEVWTTVKDRHYDPALGGLDWQGVREQYLPRIEKATSMDEGRSIMNQMLGLLKQTHISVIPASAYSDMEGGSAPGTHTPGIGARVLEGRAIVTQVQAGSPAEKAGIKPGWEILKIDGRELAPIIKRIEDNYSNSTLKDLVISRAAEAAINGQTAEAAEVEFHDGNVAKTFKLDKTEPRGARIKFGEMPASYFWVETSSSDDNIRVIRFNIWLNPEAVAAAFSEIMKDSDKAKGFVIDLRGNPGGIGGMATGVAGWFTSQRGLKLGTMTMRDAKLNFVVSPRPNATEAPLAILVDGRSASTSEIFAGGMQDLKRARIFGTHTAGAALPSNFARLPNGDGFQYIVANYISEGGKQLEGTGVAPDETVKLTQSELLAGKDPVLDRAVAWIMSQK
jgi:carboxyl-terminal processing protease